MGKIPSSERRRSPRAGKASAQRKGRMGAHMRYSRRGRVEELILEGLERQGALHMTLIDPDVTPPEEAGEIAKKAEEAGTFAIMIGGSIGVSERMVDETILEIKKKTSVPVILFPGSTSELSKHADAVWFLSVLNSNNPYFIVGSQMQAAPVVKRYGIEALPLAYIIMGDGGAVGYVSQARPISFDRADIAAAYALAAQYMGFRFVYLEGGSGGRPIPPEVISTVRKTVDLVMVVGGGIRTGRLAYRAVEAGADIVVTGTAVEEAGDAYSKVKEIVDAVRKAARRRRGLGGP